MCVNPVHAQKVSGQFDRKHTPHLFLYTLVTFLKDILWKLLAVNLAWSHVKSPVT